FPAAPPRPAPIAVPTPGATRLPSAPPRSEPMLPPIPPPPLSVAAARPYVGLRNDAPSPTLTFVSGDDFSAEWYELRNDRIIGLPPRCPSSGSRRRARSSTTPGRASTSACPP